MMLWIFNESTASGRLPDSVTTNLGLLRSAMRDGDKEFVSFGHEKSGACATRSIDFGSRLIVVRVSLLDGVDFARTANRINAMPLAVIEEFVGVTRDVDLGNDLAGVRIQDNQFRRQSAPNEESVIRLIERHRKIRKSQICFPRHDDCALFAIDHCYVARVRNIHEDSLSVFLQFERFGMRRKFD
jgi:hypothetical protein